MQPGFHTHIEHSYSSPLSSVRTVRATGRVKSMPSSNESETPHGYADEMPEFMAYKQMKHDINVPNVISVL